MSDTRNTLLLKRLALLSGILLLAVLILWFSLRERDLALRDIKRQGELIVLTRNAPTIYYEGPDGEAQGPEHDLAQSFAEFLGVTPRFEVYYSVAEILEAIREGQGHLAAANLTRTELREQEFLFGPDYRSVQQQVVCHRDEPTPKNIEDLVGLNLKIILASSYEENLKGLKKDIPALNWTTTDEQDTEELLEMVGRKELDCTIADSNIVAINRRYYPELEIAFPISEEEPLAWIVTQKAQSLRPALEKWFTKIETSGELAMIEERYYGYVEIFDYVDMSAFMQRIEKRLPPLQPLLKTVAEKHDLPWTLLAAVGYQESHWNPKATSPTGVRGLMMLTQNTAKSVGVKNRLDPAQSIRGGARYLRRMLERLPESVTDEDRLWFALAAYNVGMGHLQDARKLARDLGKDPDLWLEMKEVLPLLARKRYYRKLKHGYARGSEPVRYVQRVRDFQDVLEQQLAQPQIANSGSQTANQ